MWKITDKPLEIEANSPVSIERVLYEYDGPQIFTSIVGVSPLLFLKVDENVDFDIFIAAQYTESSIGYVRDGKLSLLALFEQDLVYLAQMSRNLIMNKLWLCKSTDLPDEYLPEPYAGTSVSVGNVPNSVIQVESLFAMGFHGPLMKRDGMPFSLLKALVDSAYDSARRILVPPVLSNTRSATFDLQVAPVKFGSLVLGVDNPIFSEQRIRKAIGNPNISAEDISAEVASNEVAFFEEIDDLSTAKQRNLSEVVASEKYATLDNIVKIIPNEDNNIDDLELSSNNVKGRNFVVIDHDVGSRLFVAHRMASSAPIVEHGAIFLINSNSHKFTIHSTRGREVTCQMGPEMFGELSRSELFRLGSIVSVKGELTRRTRRDQLDVRSMPILRPASSKHYLFD